MIGGTERLKCCVAFDLNVDNCFRLWVITA